MIKPNYPKKKLYSFVIDVFPESDIVASSPEEAFEKLEEMMKNGEYDTEIVEMNELEEDEY